MPLPIVKLLSQRVSKHCNNLELNPNKIGQNQGFTMVELLLTLVLLITLTSIAVTPAVNSVQLNLGDFSYAA